MEDKKPPISISVINMKGGVGKTTISVLLAKVAAERYNLNVLAVDLDPQANMSQSLMRQEYNKFVNDRKPSIVEIFDGFQPSSGGGSSPSPLIMDSVAVNINSYSHGEGKQGSLRLLPSRFDFSDNLKDVVNVNRKVLANVVANHFQDVDIIFIDCAPTESLLTEVAYHASGYVLVPVKLEYFSTIGFPLLKKSLDDFQGHHGGHKIEVCGIVINQPAYENDSGPGPESRRAKEEVEEECRKNNWKMFKNELRFSRGYPKMMRGDYSYPGNAPGDFRSFAGEFFSSLGF